MGTFSSRTSLTCLVIGVRADTRGDYCEGRGRGDWRQGMGGGILNLIPPGPGAGPSIATHEPGHGIVLCCRAGHINTRA